MKRMLISIFTSFGIATVLSLWTPVSIPGSVLGTLYTVAGVIFSVGMSLTISPKTGCITNERMKQSIRKSYIRIRNTFLYYFAADTLLFITAEVAKSNKLPEIFNVTCACFLLISVIYYTVNFISLQKLGEEIEDQIAKEKGNN